MKIRISTTAAICAAALAAAGTAAADPAPAVVTYRAASTDTGSVTVELTHGRFAVDPDGTAATVRDDAGRVLDTLPLAYAIGDQRMPIRARIGGDATTLTLTPETAGLRRDAPTPVASPLENQLAMNDLVNAVSIGTSVGALIGTAVGAVLGIGLGIALAGASCAVLSVGCVVAVLPIVSLAGAAGGVAGLVLAGGPATAAGLYRYVTTLLAPPGTSEYAPDLRGRPGVPDTGR
ncbi:MULTISPECIES: hypothetical protein [Nocardia]|uniref:DUF8020 domain-containing protein n=2 Tax=Nocardia TaxID=1817 RepID=A0A2T2YZ08_9NOCA|nr:MULTISPECIES: hypothetical protein [Nocardia]MBF6448502.1 hypothetical protein [Nocardia elegans]PSR60740.1 hypothetical protein C8259_21980 [Nocardia nova]